MSFAPEHPVVWTELPCTDLEKSVTFYNRVFGYDMSIDNNGPNPMAMLPGADKNSIAGHLYPGNPAEEGNGPTVHLAVPDTLEAAAGRCKEAGGAVLSAPIAIPAGRFVYAVDPDGNSIGLFQAA
ncbi:VOC family protein [Pontivivens ytuae]|uniref:VOC family protein n=1 Tax=Pontivivens ytuae TaxID=2789856 RepID=A0A7S9LUS9_9RHOB|nr:VOC family protein [Pontivivens ytuae]QPH55556.1 VOC family protein [Pontivivens ytuae]